MKVSTATATQAEGQPEIYVDALGRKAGTVFFDGLGRKTLEKIDAAMAERGLTFAEAS